MPHSRSGFIPLLLVSSLVFSPLMGSTYAASTPQVAQKRVEKNSANTATEDLNSRLDANLFYQLLVAELQSRGGDLAVAYAIFYNTAKKTGDVRLYEKSVQLALQLRAGQDALNAAQAWKKAAPDSASANRAVWQILIALNRLTDAQDPLQQELINTPAPERKALIASLPYLLSKSTDTQGALNLAEKVLQPELQQADTRLSAWVTIGRLRLKAQKLDLAIQAATKAYTLDPTSQSVALLNLELVSARQTEAEALLQNYLKAHPKDAVVQLQWARVLIEQQRYPEAVQNLKTLTQQQPELDEAWLLLGSLHLELKSLDQAEQAFLTYLRLAEDNPSPALIQAYLSLAQLAQQQGDLAMAERWLDRVQDPLWKPTAQVRKAHLLAKKNQWAQARQLIKDLPGNTPESRQFKFNAEVQLLRDFKQWPAAYQMLAQKLKKTPKDSDTLYELALVAEKLGHGEEMETLLQRALKIKPDFYAAKNALGYAWADRGVRLKEAHKLISAALKASPNDPFIMDSLGWVAFRQGQHQEAATLLRQALDLAQDTEIAAHLGEVLWVMGQKEQAQKVWREGQAKEPENETLNKTLKRLKVTLP